MRMNCPACGAEFTLDVLIAHEGAREALVEAMGMNLTLGKLLVQYLALFRPPKRQLTMDRVAAILREISRDIKAAQITRHGRVWAVPLESWKWGLEEIVAKKANLTLPLKSHAYLHQMLIAAADKIEADAERRTEDRRRSTGLQPGQAVAVRSEAPAAVQNALQHFVKSEVPAEARNLIDQLKRQNKGK